MAGQRQGRTNRTRAGSRKATLLAGTVIAFGSMLPLVSPQEALAQAATQSISVQGGTLTAALNDLAAQTGLQIIFDAGLANGKTTGGVSGTMTPNAALTALLAGTGVRASFAGRDQIALAAQGSAATDHVTLDPISVYGARDATTLEDTSASIGIVTAEDIDYGQIQYLPGAFRRLANVEKGATNNTGIVVRGMNFEGFSPAGSPMGSIYVDGILQSRYNSRFGARSLWDAEQVEVYRGPQSTLSGRSATAGAIYLKTKDPEFDHAYVLSTTAGNKNLVGADFIVNTPLSQENGIAMRIAGSFEQLTTEIDYPTYDIYENYDDFRTELSGNIRAKLLYEPLGGDTRALLTYSYSKDRPNERLVDPLTGAGNLYLLPTLAEFREIEVQNTGLEVTHAITPALKLTSQTGLSYGLTERESMDNGTPGVANAWYGTYADTLATQEFRLNYDLDRWSWVAGVFGSYEYQDSDLFWRATEFSLQQESLYDRRTANLAAFGEATYEFLPGWKATLGGRVDYIEETTKETGTSTVIGYGATTTYTNAAISEVNAVPKIGLARQFNENHVAGATYSQGFRTGGYYLDPVTNEPIQYDPEFADNYEVFYKGRFLEDRLRLNSNIFYTRYRDQQVESIAPGIGGGAIVSNAASSYSYGFEFEPTFDVNQNLSVFASVGYLHTEFEDFDHRIYGDLSGESFPEAPEWSVAFGGLYTFNNGFYIGGDAKFVSDYNARFNVAAPLEVMDSHFLLNAQAGIRKANWEINAFAENLLDEEYYTTLELQGSGVNPTFAQAGPSRLFGLNVRVIF
ncbi:iron complex outermembrane receptor protein [Amorphus suaedae]